MSIEQQIEHLTTAVEKLAYAIQQAGAVPQVGQAASSGKLAAPAAAEPAKKSRGRPRKNVEPEQEQEQAQEPKVEKAEEPEVEKAEELEVEEPEAADPGFDADEDDGEVIVTIDDVRRALVDLATASDQDKARNLLTVVGGVTALSKLDPSRYAEVCEAADKKLKALAAAAEED